MVSTHGRKQGKNCKNLKANLIRLEKKKRCASYLKELLMKKRLKKQENRSLEKIQISVENNYEPEPEPGHYFPSSVWQDYLHCFYEESDCEEMVGVKYEKCLTRENFNPSLELINVDNTLAKKLYNQYKLLELDNDLRSMKDEDFDFTDDLEEVSLKEETTDEGNESNCEVKNSIAHPDVVKVKEEENDPIIEADTEFNFKHSKRKKFEYRPYLDPFVIKIVLDDVNEAKESIRPNLRSSSLIKVDRDEMENASERVLQFHKKYRRKKSLGARHFQCLMCGAKFKTKGNLKAHCEVTHSEERNYQCTVCKVKFKTKYHLNTHCLKIHKKNKIDPEKSNGPNHITESRYPKRKSCQVKSYALDQIGLDKSDLTCSLCQIVLNNKRLLNMHMLVAHTKKPSTKTNQKKINKLKTKRNADRRAYNLRKILAGDNSMDSAIVIPPSSPTGGIIIFECHDCSACYSSKCLLKNHILETHLFYHCPFPDCGLIFKKKVNLQRHSQRVHPKEKIPGRPKVSSTSLNKPHRKKTRTSQLNLNLTFRKAKKEESCSPINKINYECDHCKATFSIKHVLTKHILHVHLKRYSIKSRSSTNKPVGRPLNVSLNSERKFQCKLCDFAFKTRSHLQSHCLQRHSDERKFTCSVCNAQFKTKGILKTHSLRMHKYFRCNNY